MTNANKYDEGPRTFQNKIEIKAKTSEHNTVFLEDALKLSGLGRYNYFLFAFSTYSLISASSEIFSVGLLNTAAQCDLDLDLYEKGLIGSLPMLGVMSSGHLWGYVADTRGRKFTLYITLGGTFLMAVMSSLANHWLFMAFTKFSSAIFASGTSAVTFTLLGESTPQSHRAKFLLFATTGLMFSQGVVAMVAYPILKATFSIPTFMGFNYRPWRLLAQAYGLLSGVNVILLYLFIYESPKFYLSRGQQEKGIEILTKMFAKNNSKSSENYPVQKVILDEEVASKQEHNFFKSIWAQTVPLFNKHHIRHSILIFYTCIVVYGVGSPFMIWIPEILNSYSNRMERVNDETFCEIVQSQKGSVLNSTIGLSTKCDDRVSDMTMYVIMACGIYGFTLSGTLSIIVRYVGKKWTFIGVHVISALAAFLLNTYSHISSISLFIITTSNASCMGITTTYAVELFPTYLRAMAVCLTMMIGRSFSFIVINLIGPHIKSNCVLLFYAIGSLIISGAIVGCFLPADKKKVFKDLENINK